MAETADDLAMVPGPVPAVYEARHLEVGNGPGRGR
jgi:hypothetical protein